MLFNSLEFLLFFPLVVVSFYILPHRYRWILLLLASYYFYMSWKAEYLFLILISTLIDYFAGLRMGLESDIYKRRNYLLLSLIANLGILFGFKYFNFFNDSVREIFNQFNVFYGVSAFNILLPVGISFYTFQSLSYSIDVYRGERSPEKHLGYFALYVAYFPQLVAGPIERSTRLLPQFFIKQNFDYKNVTDGLKIMLWGFFKKIVIADRLALYVNEVYNNPTEYHGLQILLATYFFAFQIYCDFSGYSDIAIGAARIMGIKLMNNFERPYYSKSIREFWKRWHISLSTWFRDYLYISLGGSRVVKWRWYYNIFIVFLVSGMWHGANWTFLIWGGLHGFYMLFSNWTKNLRNNAVKIFKLNDLPMLHKYIKIFITFHLVLIGWIFFRANNISDAILIFSRIIEFDFTKLSSLKLSFSWYLLSISFISIIILEIVHLFERKESILNLLNKQPIWLRFSIYYAIIFYIIIFGQFEQTDFIYFQF